MKVLILGKGFIGNQVAKNIPEAIHISRADIDYTDHSKFTAFLSTIKGTVDTIINCVGYTGNPNVDACETDKEKCYYYNVVLPQTLFNDSLLILGDIKFIHVSSGCIYDGYEKDFTELDVPNFGIFSEKSSFYSKTKHICETILSQWDEVAIVRLRIPFTSKPSRKNYITKLLNYDNLIDYRNSKTDVETLGEFIKYLAFNFERGTYNAVHSNPLTTSEVIAIMKEQGLLNPRWQLVPYNRIPIIANRSNCILSTKKVEDFGFYFDAEETVLRNVLKEYKKFL